MEKYSLKSIIGIRFIYAPYIHSLKEVVKKLEEQSSSFPIEIDIAGLKLMPEAVVAINELISKRVKFINSENENDNTILQYNYELKTRPREETIPLPKIQDRYNIKDYIKALNTIDIYTIPSEDSETYIALAVAILLLRPQVNIDITDYVGEVTSFICTILYAAGDSLPMTQMCDEFMYLYKGNFIKFRTEVKTNNEIFYVYGIGYVNWSTLMNRALVLPAYLGSINVYKIGLGNVWQPVLDQVSKTVENEKKRLTLAEYLKEEL